MASKGRTLGAEVEGRLRAVLSAAGFELLLCQYVEGQKLLRLFVDRAPSAAQPFEPEPADRPYKSSVTLEDCRACSGLLGEVLRGEPSLPQLADLHLEVSSPGVERPLCSLGDHARFVGHLVAVRLKRPHSAVGKGRSFEARIASVDGQQVTFELASGAVAVAIDDIERANLVVDWARLTGP